MYRHERSHDHMTKLGKYFIQYFFTILLTFSRYYFRNANRPCTLALPSVSESDVCPLVVGCWRMVSHSATTSWGLQ